MATVSFRMDDTLKRQTEAILEALGLNMTTAMTMFAKTIVREAAAGFKHRSFLLPCQPIPTKTSH